MNVTEREKRLLALSCTVLVLVVMVRCLVMPALGTHRALKEELQILTREQQERRRRLSALSHVDEAIARHELALAKAASSCGEYLSTEEMDALVTELFLDHGLTPQALTLTQGVSGTLEDYLSPAPAKAAGGEEYDGVPLSSLMDGGEDAVRAIEEKGERFLYIGTAQLEAWGTQGDFLALLDDVEENFPALRITAFSIGGGPEEAGTVSCTMEFYMYGS